MSDPRVLRDLLSRSNYPRAYRPGLQAAMQYSATAQYVSHIPNPHWVANETGSSTQFRDSDMFSRYAMIANGTTGRVDMSPPRSHGWQTGERRSPPSEGSEPRRRMRARHGSLRASPTGSAAANNSRPNSYTGTTPSATQDQTQTQTQHQQSPGHGRERVNPHWYMAPLPARQYSTGPDHPQGYAANTASFQQAVRSATDADAISDQPRLLQLQIQQQQMQLQLQQQQVQQQQQQMQLQQGQRQVQPQQPQSFEQYPAAPISHIRMTNPGSADQSYDITFEHPGAHSPFGGLPFPGSLMVSHDFSNGQHSYAL